MTILSVSRRISKGRNQTGIVPDARRFATLLFILS